MKAVLYGVASLVSGLLLYFVSIGVMLNYYDEQPRPGWLIAFLWIAVTLAALGLLTLVSAATGLPRRGLRSASRENPREKRS
jgi:hypothetical protein